MIDPYLEGLFVGKVRTLRDHRGEWRTAYGRVPATGPLPLDATGLPGDGTQHRTHGGPDRALLAYAASSYDRFEEELPGIDFPRPSFGENLLVRGFDEWTVAVGDIWRVGEARVQVTMPRAPCSNISRFTNVPDMLNRVIESGRVGWLLRVLTPGYIASGDKVVLESSPHPEWTIAHVYEADCGLRAKVESAIAESRIIVELPALADQWREGIRKRLDSMAARAR